MVLPPRQANGIGNERNVAREAHGERMETDGNASARFMASGRMMTKPTEMASFFNPNFL